MTSWKLVRVPTWEFQQEYNLESGNEYKVGRTASNFIVCCSLTISRSHCIIKVDSDGVKVKDEKSSNGTFIDNNKIEANKFTTINDLQKLSIGTRSDCTNIDIEKFVFQLIKKSDYTNNLCHSDTTLNLSEVLLNRKKRESEESGNISKVEVKKTSKEESCVDLTSDDEDGKIIPYQLLNEDPVKNHSQNGIKVELSIKEENNDDNYDSEIFSFKQELEDTRDDDFIVVDSDSESEIWFTRLSQSSPGKHIKKEPGGFSNEVSSKVELDTDDEFSSDLVELPGGEQEVSDVESDIFLLDQPAVDECDGTALVPPKLPDVVTPPKTSNKENKVAVRSPCSSSTEDGVFDQPLATLKAKRNLDSIRSPPQVVAPHSLVKRKKSEKTSKKTHKEFPKRKSDVKLPSSKEEIKVLKEKRKLKLRESAEKRKRELPPEEKESKETMPKKQKVGIKNTKNTRGECLAKAVTDKPISRHEVLKKKSETIVKEDSKESSKTHREPESVKNCKDKTNEVKTSTSVRRAAVLVDIPLFEDKKQQRPKGKTKKKEADTSKGSLNSTKNISDFISPEKNEIKSIIKITKKNGNVKKSVRFSTDPVAVREFNIEEGHRLRSTQEAKIKDYRPPAAVLSMEKQFLKVILHWSPRWLTEQEKFPPTQPPPILAHGNPPADISHSFLSHNHYVHVISDLLLMEVWANLTQSFTKKRVDDLNWQLKMTLSALPHLVGDTSLGPCSIMADLSLAKSQASKALRVGELLLIDYGSQGEQTTSFFYVSNVRNMPAPPQNVNLFFTITLSGIWSERLKKLRPGDTVIGRPLYYVKNELVLIEAIDELRDSPLSRVVLKPEPTHFPSITFDVKSFGKCKWTAHLNEKQLEAVGSSVIAALTDQPCINMIQGPPGTGKSNVICATVMKCLYGDRSVRSLNRNKILVCATSNTAVDVLLLRLLAIRQTLPQMERFRMVRVGRDDAMHPEARNISLQTLARRSVEKRCESNYIDHEEVATLEAKVNSWITAAQSATDPARKAYNEHRLEIYRKRLANATRGTAGMAYSERMADVERMVIEGADIIMTTLASSGSNKLKCLKHRIALCIIDEAGQAIEPETLVPLTLHVTKLTLVGDPQQLPGYICSQRAKQHGLGESLFSRLSSITGEWPNNPVITLNTQYRMHPSICDYPNRAFYNGILKSRSNIVSMPFAHYKLLLVPSGDRGQDEKGANVLESWAAVRVYLAATGATKGMSSAIITPYSAQKGCVCWSLLQIKQSSSEVHTLDSFQGQERDIIVVSLARSNGLGFLSHAGRMNVLLTRAKHSLFICINPDSTTNNRLWQTLLEDAKRRNAIAQLPKSFCAPIIPNQFNPESVLSYLT